MATRSLADIAADWPEFAELRGAASAFSHRQRLAQVVSILVNELRVAFAAALLCERAPHERGGHQTADEARDLETMARARTLYAHARSVVDDGGTRLASEWFLRPEQCNLVVTQLALAVGGGMPLPPPQTTAGIPLSGPRGDRQPFEHRVHLFHAAVAQGMPLDRALQAFRHMHNGAYSHDGHCYFPDSPELGPIADRITALAGADRMVIPGGVGERDITLFLAKNSVAAVVGDSRLRISWLAEARKRTGGLESLPDFISLPRDEQGRPIIPKSRVTALVEASEAWATELGQLDAVSAVITTGRLVMPKVSAPSQQTFLRNHPSWENDEAAKRALGPVIAKWLVTGVLEYVGWDDRAPVLLQPCGAVPKGTAPFYRLITDARHANHMYADWGVTYTTAAQLSCALNRCDFTFSIDISDAYHLALWTGCGGELRPIKRPVLASADGPGGRLSWIDALVNGCDPASCLGGCDKDLSGIMIEGHIFRFASCQFGQKTAGSPLGALVRSVARYFARLPSPVHVAAWVDDLIFIMQTPEHGDCDGFEGGCEVCTEYHGRAVLVQDEWRKKAARLHITLSEKGHEVSQRGAFTGVGIDTLRGVFYMLPDKLASTFTAIEQLCASVDTTPRLISRVRGKALHYACAIPYVRIAAPSLSQNMHDRESGIGPTKVPLIKDEDESEDFKWDQPMQLSARARRALAFMREAMERFGNAGQPLWPTVPSSFYSAFLEGRLGGVHALVITYDASVHGWGAVIRTSPEDPGLTIVGGYRLAQELLGEAFVDPAALGDNPTAQVYREALAGLLAAQAAGQHFALSEFVVLVRGDCSGALASFRKGSFRSPALQDIALLFNEVFLRAKATPPLLLHVPGRDLVLEGVDGLSRELAASRRIREATDDLRAIVREQAAALGEAISVDLFATAENSLVPRFFALTAEPLAEGADAFTQLDWGRSRCPHCGHAHREFGYAFPPTLMLPHFVNKARADGFRGVIVVPFTTSHTWWPTLMAASLTHVPGSKNRCVVVPATPKFIRHNQALGSAQRLAVLAVDFSRVRPCDLTRALQASHRTEAKAHTRERCGRGRPHPRSNSAAPSGGHRTRLKARQALSD